jgi:hypothetical protein
MIHHDDILNYIVGCILNRENLINDTDIHIIKYNKSSILSILECNDSISSINQFYKDIQSYIDNISKYEYPNHINEY